MDIVVPIKLVPDLVEELEINEEGTDLDRDFLSYKINEFCDHALEEALRLKETHGGSVTVLALDSDDTDKVLFTALAKGADRAVKVKGAEEGITSRRMARLLVKALEGIDFDLILTGVQAADDRDGQLGVLLAAELSIPHLSVVSDISVSGSVVTLHKEYAGGVLAKFEVEPKVLLGIQAARETPRYAPVSRVRQIMRDTQLEEIEVSDSSGPEGTRVRRMFTPERSEGAEMLEGDAAEIAGRIAEILNQKRSGS